MALQKAFYDVASGSAFQAACGLPVGVYDHIPAKAIAPYLVISDIQSDGDAAQSYDGTDAHANITVWSNQARQGGTRHHSQSGARLFRAPIGPRAAV